MLLGNDPAEEDVDIGGNEPPISSYPPVEIEKDMGHKSSKCIGSQSSSGKARYTSSLVGFYVCLCFPICIVDLKLCLRFPT